MKKITVKIGDKYTTQHRSTLLLLSNMKQLPSEFDLCFQHLANLTIFPRPFIRLPDYGSFFLLAQLSCLHFSLKDFP